MNKNSYRKWNARQQDEIRQAGGTSRGTAVDDEDDAAGYVSVLLTRCLDLI